TIAAALAAAEERAKRAEELAEGRRGALERLRQQVERLRAGGPSGIVTLARAINEERLLPDEPAADSVVPGVLRALRHRLALIAEAAATRASTKSELARLEERALALEAERDEAVGLREWHLETKLIALRRMGEAVGAKEGEDPIQVAADRLASLRRHVEHTEQQRSWWRRRA